MDLFAHQQKFISLNPDKSALVWSCGTGKTRTALEWAKKRNMRALVICPKSLKTNWYREARKWHVPVDVLSKEEFRADHEYLFKAEQVIVDEVHNGFLTPHFKSQMSKALRNYLKFYRVHRVLLLSATVYTSSPWNIFNLAYYLGYKIDWLKFKYMFFDEVRYGQRVVLEPKEGCEIKLAKLTKEIANVVDIYDCMDVPLQFHAEPEYFSLTLEQQRAIKDSYDPLPIVRYTKQHEIENGVLIGDNYSPTWSYRYDKQDRLLCLCQENNKIAIVCRYNAQIDWLAKFLKQFKPFIIRGDVKNRDEVCQQAEMAREAVVLIQADSSLGYELPSFGLCVFVSMSYSYVNWVQMQGRFLRMNNPSRTTFLYLLTEGESVDKAVYEAIKRKEDFSIELYKKN